MRIPFDNSYARLPAAFYERVEPAQVPSPTLIRLNRRLCTELQLDAKQLASEAGVSVLAGNEIPETADPIAMAYAGHQFGGFNPRLGDGRAILLGEVVDRNGIYRDLQLKGSGRTPFSRGGDGKATLSAVLREYVLSEAMFALGVPTTRALAAVSTGETIYRETDMPGAVLTRVAHSHVRVGTFQFFSAQRDTASLMALADYVMLRHFPMALEAEHPVAAMLAYIVERQAQLVARWMQLGFIHGVMNTDNTQVVGETIDYGPCAFMDDFHPQQVFSAIDRGGRYAWDQQPVIAKWNLSRLAEALLPILSTNLDQAHTLASRAVEGFNPQFQQAYTSGFARKLGLVDKPSAQRPFIEETLATLAKHHVDFTLFFRQLTRVASGEEPDTLLSLFAKPSKGAVWLSSWRKQIAQDSISAELRAAIMRGVNPMFIPRNHRVEEVIANGLEGDFEPFHRLVTVLANPYEEQPEHSDYERPPRENEIVRQTFCNT